MVELTVLTREPERVASSVQRVIDRLSLGSRSRELLKGLPAIVDVESVAGRVELRWVGIRANDPTEAEAQVVETFSGIVAPYELEVHETHAQAYEE